MEELGMDRVFDEDYPKVTVGEFTICKQDDTSVWIQTESGEGGQFSNALFEEAVRKFYKENF